MRLWIQVEGTRGFLPVPGPADLAGKTGVLRVEGLPSTDAEATRWIVPLGAFVARGGEIRRLS